MYVMCSGAYHILLYNCNARFASITLTEKVIVSVHQTLFLMNYHNLNTEYDQCSTSLLLSRTST